MVTGKKGASHHLSDVEEKIIALKCTEIIQERRSNKDSACDRDCAVLLALSQDQGNHVHASVVLWLALWSLLELERGLQSVCLTQLLHVLHAATSCCSAVLRQRCMDVNGTFALSL